MISFNAWFILNYISYAGLFIASLAMSFFIFKEKIYIMFVRAILQLLMVGGSIFFVVFFSYHREFNDSGILSILILVFIWSILLWGNVTYFFAKRLMK